MVQGDPVRLLTSASEAAQRLIDNSENLKEVRQMLVDLQTVERQLAEFLFFDAFLFDKQVARRKLLNRQQLFRQRVFDYFQAIGPIIGVTLDFNQCTYAYATGVLHGIELKIVKPYADLIREQLLQLRSMLPT
ncbi:MAG: hypothetical protein A2729_01205 [Candidatus Buchananbacteria bacterium RIFCSPHIGHO2_01_FULL_39_14]|uniref:Uncharacterized protein n=2 Tax=Candidatus Buchananiibacteriota TaxID=1817903 RepID=A0A1G1YU61_9BACT|nr:MAG: hypothetical protein A2729_01205 [Candidatus Buchananbacteria bacterium RIFCSPHIGHO2_01_FULL_39_14]OGY49160.1 MAG: hypothetical protein A3D39_05635 [Candidatus Buchananbacteria bacterium RIFCSPHIGHO2_02_FULL_39_17]OGY55893.1 MAG: hypothetical protein A2912_02815 [Candidatus Buchananbacteria bacterium RIFCSPLOWO2_01_FULL_40_23b]